MKETEIITIERSNYLYLLSDSWTLKKIKCFISEYCRLTSDCESLIINNSYDFTIDFIKFIKLVDFGFYIDLLDRFQRKKEDEEYEKLNKENKVEKVED